MNPAYISILEQQRDSEQRTLTTLESDLGQAYEHQRTNKLQNIERQSTKVSAYDAAIAALKETS